MSALKILYQDPYLVAIDKPPKFWVHPPEDPTIRYSQTQNCLRLLKRQIGHYVYPVHRIDRSTSGVVLYSLSPELASELNRQFRERQIRKVYYAVVRGVPAQQGIVDSPLQSESGNNTQSITLFETLCSIELPYANKRFSTSRFSLLRVTPMTGSHHQIRRHMKRLRHPLIGDSVYGDGLQNRIFSEQLQIRGLLLRAYSISFFHHILGKTMTIRSNWNSLWHRVFDVFGFCPYDPGQ